MTNELINEVKKVNRQAALYMKRRLPLLVTRKQYPSSNPERYFERPPQLCNSLIGAFKFSATKQGIDYWWNVVEQLTREYQ